MCVYHFAPHKIGIPSQSCSLYFIRPEGGIEGTNIRRGSPNEEVRRDILLVREKDIELKYWIFIYSF